MVLNGNRKILIRRLWKSFQVYHVMAETFDVMSSIRAEHGQLIAGNAPSLLHQPFEHSALFKRIVQNDDVGKKVDIFYLFLALFRDQSFDLAVVSKRKPLAKCIELLNFVRGLMDNLL
jgi:hypothetical protein